MAHSVTLYIQPVYNYDSEKVEYAEVLVRQYRGIDTVPTILRFVERNGIELNFDIDIIRETLNTLTHNKPLGYPVSINLCSKTVELEGAADKILEVISEYDIDTNRIILEINEDTSFDNEVVIRNLKKLHNSGIKLALDDFGTGKTTVLSFVINAFDIIKLDKSFLDTEHESSVSKCQVLKAVVDMFKKLNFDLIIEGIENEKQLTFIRKIGLNKVQGYLYAKPEPISEFSTKKKRGKMVC